MDSCKLSPIDQIKKCILENKNFVLEGGAGSGKTETLKGILEYLSVDHPQKKAVCITHTNLAVDEIKARIGQQLTVSTIHSFLNSFIKNYKKDIHSIIHNLFIINTVTRQNIEEYGGDEKLQKLEEHKNYKRIYEKFTTALYTRKRVSCPPVEGKRIYDQDPEEYNATLNDQIETLNKFVIEEIAKKDFNFIEYNDTRFDDFRELSFGHDGLLKISSLLFAKHTKLGKILQDTFDCIFVDEYQDTNKQVLNSLLLNLPCPEQIVIGLFGDSMQGIYEDGVGDVNEYIASSKLIRIEKADNYRCSEQVVNFINRLRNDSLSQEVALKKRDDGTTEPLTDRQGEVGIFYAIAPAKPPRSSSLAEKEKYKLDYSETLEKLIATASSGQIDYRHLKLTNKSIAMDLKFGKLYSMFSDRYLEPKEYIDKHLRKLLLVDLFELCHNYKCKDYNKVLSKLKKLGFAIRKLSDKQKLKQRFDDVLNVQGNVVKTLEKAFDLKLLKKSEGFSEYFETRERFLEDLAQDKDYSKFKALLTSGKTTYKQIKSEDENLTEGEFKELERKSKKEVFYTELFSDEFTFEEVCQYLQYLDEKTSYITMHNTKGSGIESVLVILEEYSWTNYNFRTVYSDSKEPSNQEKRTSKLFYVACSRAETNLRCIRVVANEEEEAELIQHFSGIPCQKIAI